MKLRSIFVTFVALMMLVMGSVVQAQDMGMDPCFGLAQADCDEINNAFVGTLGALAAGSATVTIDADVSLSGVPDTEDFTLDSTTTLDILQGTNAVIPVDMGLALNAEFVDLVGLGLTSTTIEARLVDGVGYLQDPTGSGMWFALDLVAAQDSPLITQQLEGLPIDPEAAAAGDLSALEDLGVDVPDMEALLSLLSLLELPGLITYERAGDVYTFTIDLSVLALLNTPEYEEELNTLTEVASAIDPSAAFIIPTLPSLLDEGTITIVNYVNDGIVDTVDFDMNFTISAGMLTGDMEAAPIVFSLDTTTAFSNLGTAPAPAAVEGAVMFDPNTFEPMLGDQ